MKVLLINSVCGIKSTGRICTDLADVLMEQGHECRIAYGRESVPEKYREISYRITSEFGVRLDAAKSRAFDNAGFNSAASTRRFIRWIREYDPDVIHLHNLHGYYINVRVLFEYLKTCGKKIVWTLHDCWPFTGHCSHFMMSGCEKWKTECGNCPSTRLYPSSMFLDRSDKNFKEKKALFTAPENLTVVTPSHWLADLIKQSYLKNHAVSVIHNGIDSKVFLPGESDFAQKYGLQEKKIVLGVASAWGKSKGLFDFAKLAEKLPEEYKIVLVGVKEEQRALLPSKILAIGRTDSAEELAEIYSAAEVFVNPTYSDNYPTVNLEACACGTPVITYRTGGSPESVPEDCVVERGDVDALAEKILRGDAACKKDLKLDKNDMLKQYIEVYGRKCD